MSYPTRMRGFSLLEVMVALIIIAVGMLGIAKMQGLALSSTTASRSRALAAIEASSLAAAMQANRVYWSNASSTPGTITIATSAGSPSYTTSNSAMGTAIGSASTSCPSMSAANVSCTCAKGNSAPCTPAANALGIAAGDIYDFAWSLASFLPVSTTTISCNQANNPVDCTIHITWTENTVAMTSQQASYAAGTAVPVVFDLYVVP